MYTPEEILLAEEKCVIFNEFKHYDEVLDCIQSIKSVTCNQNEEYVEENLKRIFNFYLEQPHLLDPYLESLITECLKVVNSSKDNPRAFHFAFRLIYLMIKTRGYKSVIRLMPHTVDDIEPTLDLLIKQDINDLETWQTQYVLLLWLSILTLIPFDLASLDSTGQLPIVVRVLTQSQRYLRKDERTQEAASFLLARLVTRPDVSVTHLSQTITWCLENLRTNTNTLSQNNALTLGVLKTLSNICKIGRRKDILPMASSLLRVVLDMDVGKGTMICRFQTKLLQRIGLLFCPPRKTNWQYQRGFRSLSDNLAPRLLHQKDVSNLPLPDKSNDSSQHKSDENDLVEVENLDEDFELEYADEVAEVIDRLINALRNQYTVVRWSAAKGLGRMCNRLSSYMVSDVLSALLLLCTRLEPFAAWHGACLALAELGRRSLLLPEKLPEVIPIVLRALFYDERSGDHSYGSNVRDAACYVCWAFARAYRSLDFAPYVQQVAKALILVSLFDREVNVRRAASAAFQENVGRQGHFPRGIEIVTTCDYFALRNRNNCFLELSAFVAQFEEYTVPMIDHLSNNLLSHWDPSIRVLAARALRVLCPFAKDHILRTVLPHAIRNSSEASLNAKQGNLFATGDLIFALRDVDLDSSTISQIKAIVPMLVERKQFRGLSGELLRKAVCHLIEQCSTSGLPLHEDPVIETWRVFLDDCICQKDSEVQAAARKAYPALLTTYLYTKNGVLRTVYRDSLFQHFMSQLESNFTEAKLAGYLSVVSRAPPDFFTGNVSRLVEKISSLSRISPKTRSWGEARKSAVYSLMGICQQLGFQHPEVDAKLLKSIGWVLLRSLSDYTLDSRGDIGSVVREAGMQCLHRFIGFLTINGFTDETFPDIVRKSVVGIVQQAVEKIDRTRETAGQVFAAILHHEPTIPHIPCDVTLRQMFPKNECDQMLWRSAHQTFPKLVPLLDLPDFRFYLVLGLTNSVGGLTEDTVLCSSEALSSYLLTHKDDATFVSEFLDAVAQVSDTSLYEERLIVPLFKFLDFLLNNPVICSLVDKESSTLCRLTKNLWTQTRSTKDVHRIKAAIDVLGGMLQFEGSVGRFSLDLLLRFLVHRYPVVRKAVATKLYECLMVYELVEPEHMDEVISLLTETIWESDLEVIQPVHDQIRAIFDTGISMSAGHKQSDENPSSSVQLNGEAGDTVYQTG